MTEASSPQFLYGEAHSIENGEKLVAQLRLDEQRMADFGAWVFTQAWKEMIHQRENVSISVSEVALRSGFADRLLADMPDGLK